ncbi:unnamed protein product [Closterium sp. NIES-54]
MWPGGDQSGSTCKSPHAAGQGQEVAGKWGSGADADAAAGPDHQCHYRSLLPHRRCCRLHRSQCLRRPHHHLHRLDPHDHPQHLHLPRRLHHCHLHRHPHRPCHPCRPCRCDASH